MRIVSAGVGLILLVQAAGAADYPGDRFVERAPPIPWSWSGFYFGVHVGGGVGATQFSDPAGGSIYGGNVRTPVGLGGGQLGYNWQVGNTGLVLGVEADASFLTGGGTNTCLASSGYFLSANCRVRANAAASVTGRVGYAMGPSGHTLLFAKGGAAWLNQKLDIVSNPLIFETDAADSRWGWTAGAGVEQAITPAWSVKVEYDYADFGSASMATPASYRQVSYPFTYAQTPGGTTSTRQTSQTVKLGLNLKLDQDPHLRWDDDAAPVALRRLSDGYGTPDAEIEIGGRAWYSSGSFQKDLGATSAAAHQNVLVSRLTYDTTAATGEVFGRADSSTNFFLKGFIGGGGVTRGKMHDEDWLVFSQTVPYSNTVSDPVKGLLAYGTFDIGYNLLRGTAYKVGGFVGYNYFRENRSAYGCTQIANPNGPCVPTFSNAVLGITENSVWHSVRLGLNGVVNLTDRLKLTADAAYLPYARLSSVDTHLLRTDVTNTVSPERGEGHGVQLEAVLAYDFGNSFSVGAGGRYWAMWATTDTSTNIFGTACPCQTLPTRTERYGAFLEASYKLGVTK